MADGWVYWDRDGGATTSSASATSTYNPDADSGYGGDSFVEDLFEKKFMGIATGGSSGEKILRGFLIGVAIGLIVGCFFCCWYPCCGGTSRRRRRELARRRRLAQDVEGGGGGEGSGGNQQTESSTQTQSQSQSQSQSTSQPQTQEPTMQEIPTQAIQDRRPD